MNHSKTGKRLTIQNPDMSRFQIPTIDYLWVKNTHPDFHILPLLPLDVLGPFLLLALRQTLPVPLPLQHLGLQHLGLHQSRRHWIPDLSFKYYVIK